MYVYLVVVKRKVVCLWVGWEFEVVFELYGAIWVHNEFESMVCFDSVIITIRYVIANRSSNVRNDHTIMTAPLPVCSAKLSMIWSG